MAELKTKPTDVNPAQYIAAIEDEERRKDVETVMKMMREATGEAPVMWGNDMVGFGKYAYKYASGHSGEWAVTGFASRKQALTLYFCGGLDNQADLLAKLGKHKTGKGCLYIKRMSDVDQNALREMIERSWANKPA